MRLVVVVALLTVLLCLLPASQAGTASEPDVVDPAGDVQYQDPVPPPHPCVPAVDLLSLWVEWTAEGALFHYTFSDLSVVEDHPEQDFTGRCFYSYTDFVLEYADGTELVDALYVDHWANPAFATGWRFYLHEAGDEAVGTVDAAAGTIDVLVPNAALGNPGPGDVIGMFRVQSTTQFMSGPGVADFATDLSPDGDACACPVPYPAATAKEDEPSATSSPSASVTASPQSSSATTTRAPAAPRPPQAVPTTAASSSDAPAAPADVPAKDSPAPVWVAVAALLGLLAVRRRLP